MKSYQEYLESIGVEVEYVEFNSLNSSGEIAKIIKKQKIEKAHFLELDDNWLYKKVTTALKNSGIVYEVLNTLGFVTPLNWSKEFFLNKKTYFQTSYYIAQRKRFSILLKEDSSPVGGSWTYDKENRKKLPKKIKIPEIKWADKNEYYNEAVSYVGKHFSKNPGEVSGVVYPYTHKQAKQALKHFVRDRIEQFGSYQDALQTNESFLFHSLLSAPINAGLITPQEVIDYVLSQDKKNKIPLNSLEGFIRQIIGWREYFRIVYDLESVNQRTKNFFGFKRKIPNSFWQANTGIEPVDIVIKRVLQNAYGHHIERLMVLGNFMLLCEFDPDEVYRWFMELFIDAYDWVMVPNIYGMSQYADGGLITTKPYISSSNYIKKMSDFKSGDWCEVWDALYWNFLHKQKKHFVKNSRMSLMYRQLDKMPEDKLKHHLKVAKRYLKSLND